MLPVFCSQIGLSVLLIGIIPSPRSAEPFSSILVICQLLTAFLLARFFEWIAQKKKLLSASAERFTISHRTLAKVETRALNASMNQFSAFEVTTKARTISTLVARAFVIRASLESFNSWPESFIFRDAKAWTAKGASFVCRTGENSPEELLAPCGISIYGKIVALEEKGLRPFNCCQTSPEKALLLR